MALRIWLIFLRDPPSVVAVAAVRVGTSVERIRPLGPLPVGTLARSIPRSWATFLAAGEALVRPAVVVDGAATSVDVGVVAASADLGAAAVVEPVDARKAST